MDGLARTAGIEGLVRELIDDAGAPGATVALSVDGERWSSGVGHADLERREQLPAEAQFSLYSITKTVIAAIVLRLVEDKLFALDDPVQSLLPEIPVETPFSIRQALNHTSGLPSYGTAAEYHEAVRDAPGTPWSAAEFVRRTLGDGLLFLPGHGWRYSNIGYLFLRQILERETGITFPQAVRQCLARPFDLYGLTGVTTLEDVQALTPGYSAALRDDGTVENAIPRYHPAWVSHGLVVSTAAETGRFLDLLLDGKMLEPRGLAAMLTGAPVAERHPWMTRPAYGLGLMMDPGNRFGVVAGHTGGGPGYATAAYHFPDVHGHRVTGVALVNRDGSDVATDIVFSMVERVANHLKAPRRP